MNLARSEQSVASASSSIPSAGNGRTSFFSGVLATPPNASIVSAKGHERFLSIGSTTASNDTLDRRSPLAHLSIQHTPTSSSRGFEPLQVNGEPRVPVLQDSILYGANTTFQLETLGFWQIVGLLLLCWLLVGTAVGMQYYGLSVPWQCVSWCDPTIPCSSSPGQPQDWNSSECGVQIFDTSEQNISWGYTPTLATRPWGLNLYAVPWLQLRLDNNTLMGPTDGRFGNEDYYWLSPQLYEQIFNESIYEDRIEVTVTSEYTDGVRLSWTRRLNLHCADTVCDALALQPSPKPQFLKRMEVKIRTPVPIDINSELLMLVDREFVSLLSIVMRYFFMLCAFLVAIQYLRRWYALRPQSLLAEQYWFFWLLPLLVVALNPLYLPNILVNNWALLKVHLWLEYHGCTLYATLLCASSWVVLQHLQNPVDTSMSACGGYGPAGSTRALVWWTLTIIVDTAGVMLSSVYAATPYGKYVQESDLTLYALSLTLGLLLIIFVIGALVMFYRAGCQLRQAYYLRTRGRRLLALFLGHMVLQGLVAFGVWLIFVYLPYLQDPSREALENINFITRHNAAYVLLAGATLVVVYIGGPVAPPEGAVPPPPYNRQWVGVPWPTQWLQFLRENGGSQTYFFFTKKEQATHIAALRRKARTPSNSSRAELGRGVSILSNVPVLAMDAVDAVVSLFNPLAQLRPTAGKLITSEHLFCLETGIEMFSLSWQAYNYQTGDSVLGGAASAVGAVGAGIAPGYGSAPMNVEQYGWKLVKVINRNHNQAIITQKGNTIAISFRGTANWENVRSDLGLEMRDVTKIGVPSRYKDRHGSCWRNVPRVHSGFLRCYYIVRENVLSVFDELLKQLQREYKTGISVYLTGHSLGGAIATIAAYDIANRLKASKSDSGINIFCYTYGAPRVGNRLFAKVYNRKVPATYRVCNEYDIVTTMPVPGFIFYHVGHEIRIDGKGNFIVAPTVVERFFGPMTGNSLVSHGLATYARSFNAVASYFRVDLSCYCPEDERPRLQAEILSNFRLGICDQKSGVMRVDNGSPISPTDGIGSLQNEEEIELRILGDSPRSRAITRKNRALSASDRAKSAITSPVRSGVSRLGHFASGQLLARFNSPEPGKDGARMGPKDGVRLSKDGMRQGSKDAVVLSMDQ